jgi:hypothetical protein
VIYRMRVYQAIPEKLAEFHRFFHEYLLPTQIRYGARLVGRWETEDGRVVAVWEYDSREEYDRIDAAVRADPDTKVALSYRDTHLGSLYTSREEVFMTSTLPDSETP